MKKGSGAELPVGLVRTRFTTPGFEITLNGTLADGVFGSPLRLTLIVVCCWPFNSRVEDEERPLALKPIVKVPAVAPALGNTPLMVGADEARPAEPRTRSEEHTSELQSLTNLVCRLLL